MTACLARSSSPLRSTTHSFEPRDFPETAKEPAIGGLFWPKAIFGGLSLVAKVRYPAALEWATGDWFESSEPSNLRVSETGSI